MAKHLAKSRHMSADQLIAYSRRQRRAHRLKVAAIAVVSIIAALALVVGAYYIWFSSSLNNALNKRADSRASEVLVDRAGNDPFYMLILGSDARNDESDANTGQLTDVIVLARIDPKNRQVSMLSIPRDTRYTYDDGTAVKINSLYGRGGVAQTIQGVSKLTGAPISHYALVHMSDCKNVVDELGGVEVEVKYEINNNDPETEENVNIQPGVQTLNGRQAQAYAISRHEAQGNQDAYRQDKIRTLIGAIIQKVLDRPVAEIPGEVIVLAQYVQTDFRAEELVQLAIDFATGSGKPKIYQASGPSEGGLDESTGQWFCYENPEGWAKVMSVMDSGGDPSTVTYD